MERTEPKQEQQEEEKEALPPPNIEEIEAEWAVMSCDCDTEWG